MTPEETLMRKIVGMILSGKDEWITFGLDGRQIRTSTVFFGKYQKLLPGWVQEFVVTLPKANESRLAVLEKESKWEKNYNGEVIFQFCIKDPVYGDSIVIETYKRLLEKGIVRTLATDGQNRNR